ncbi:MAG TPA: hypothetical protein VNV86_11780 [Candidatus Acidoferrum sp.]|nr:hypothetical protein [Candidatus Acidoferrum sp.]
MDATAAMYAARRARDAAKSQQVRDHALIARLDGILAAAESAALAAQRELDQHVREHCCKA